MTSDAASDITATRLSAYLCVGWVIRGRIGDDVWGREGSSLRETTGSWSLSCRSGVDFYSCARRRIGRKTDRCAFCSKTSPTIS
jgi:hypothetical protein